MTRRTALTALAAALLAGRASAGLYLPAERGEEPLPVVTAEGQPKPLAHDDFRSRLADAVAAGIDRPGNKDRQRYLDGRDRLLHKGVENLTADEAVSLGGYQLRLRDFAGAMTTLRQASRLFPRDRRIAANLALAMYAEGDPSAEGYQSQAVPPDGSWLAKVEAYQKQLFRLRNREARLPAKPTGPDDLFGLTFTAADGSYRAGPLDHLDPAALAGYTAAVQQLLYWSPDDTRLYWLLGELYNARGDVEAAAVVFDELVDARRYGVEELREHRRVVKAEAARMAEARAEAQRAADEKARRWLPDSPQLVAVLGVGGGLFVLLLVLQVRQMWRGGGVGGCPACGGDPAGGHHH